MGDSKPSLLARLFLNLHWRWTCPDNIDNIDDIASDFINNQNTYSRTDLPRRGHRVFGNAVSFW